MQDGQVSEVRMGAIALLMAIENDALNSAASN